MDRFADSVAAKLRKLQTRNFTVSRCIGFPNCDGDLPGEEHSKNCPESKMPSLPEKWVRLSELEPLIARLEAPDQLERIKAEHPKLSQALDALSEYISRQRLRGQSEIEPYLAAQALGTTEAYTLGLLKLLEDGGLLKHSYNIYCARQRTFLTSVQDVSDIPSVISCRYCDVEHCNPDDFEVELVFKVLDPVGKNHDSNIAAAVLAKLSQPSGQPAKGRDKK